MSHPVVMVLKVERIAAVEVVVVVVAIARAMEAAEVWVKVGLELAPHLLLQSRCLQQPPALHLLCQVLPPPMSLEWVTGQRKHVLVQNVFLTGVQLGRKHFLYSKNSFVFPRASIAWTVSILVKNHIYV